VKLLQTVVASFAVAASSMAFASVSGSAGGPLGTFADLSSTGANTGDMTGSIDASIVGGSVLSTSLTNNYLMPVGTVGNYLAAGPTAGTPAEVTFDTPLTSVSFLWGSPDTFNQLTVLSSGVPGGTAFLATDFFAAAMVNGNNANSGYVLFTASAGDTITGLRFTSNTNAFESSNYSTTPAIPEPETYALMLAGLGVMGFIARRRKAA